MPPHHHGYADEWDWEDLPVSAQKAASILGYDEHSWDAAEKVAYHAKPFEDLSADEKRAALYLGRSPLDYKLKNIKWEAINDTMKRHATALGWTEDTWNRNFPIYDLDIEYLYWSELTDEQKDAACYFGYNQNLWDETHEEEDFDGTTPAAAAAPATNLPEPSVPSKPSAPSKLPSTSKPSSTTKPSSPSKPSSTVKPSSSASEEKKDGDDDDKKKKNRPKFTQSPAYGAGGGTVFDDGNHMHIDEITVAADMNMVHGIMTNYRGKQSKNGNIGRDNSQTFKLRPGECITSVKLTTNSKGVLTSLTFFTNQGAKLGPCGNDKGGQLVVKAPDGAALCGFHGTAQRHINSIGFKWGPNPKA